MIVENACLVQIRQMNALISLSLLKTHVLKLLFIVVQE